MRHVRNPQMELGEIGIEDIRINLKSRDDIPALLLGLQHLYADEETRTRLFALLEEHMLPGVDRTVGRPGMELWRILVMGVVMQGLGCDFDRLHELVNEHMTLRQFLGHADIWCCISRCAVERFHHCFDVEFFCFTALFRFFGLHRSAHSATSDVGRFLSRWLQGALPPLRDGVLST